MTGKTGRSGRPSSDKFVHQSDGPPQSPRTLTKRAQELFDWLCDRLETESAGSVWRRVDGSTLATMSELLLDQESVADGLSKDPCNDKLLRLRIQLSDRIYKFSSLIGLTPIDRQRLPANEVDEPESEWD